MPSVLPSGPFDKHGSQTDNGIAQHVDLALRVLRDAIPVRTPESSNPFEDYRAALASLSSARAAAASGVKQLYFTLDDCYASLPAVAELQHDAAIIDSKLGQFAKDKSLSERLLQVAYVEELDKMVKLLEADPTCLDTLPGAIRTSVRVSELKETETGTSPPTLKVGVKTELERAGRMDRVTLIRAQERGLDAVSFPALY